MKWKLSGILAIASFLVVSCATAPSTSVVSASPSDEGVSQATPAVSTPPSSEVVSQETPAVLVLSQSVVKSGMFVAGEHPTTGTVQIVTENNQQFVQLGADFKTSEMGPDLVVILHRAANVLGTTRPPAYPLAEGTYVVLAPLQQFQGAQRYPIPANVNPADYASAAIWCRKFNATFGAATLQ